MQECSVTPGFSKTKQNRVHSCTQAHTHTKTHKPWSGAVLCRKVHLYSFSLLALNVVSLYSFSHKQEKQDRKKKGRQNNAPKHTNMIRCTFSRQSSSPRMSSFCTVLATVWQQQIGHQIVSLFRCTKGMVIDGDYPL